jgi:hypothetical protein
MDLTTLQAINTLLGLFNPIVIEVLKVLITNDKTPKWVSYVISFVFSALVGLVTTLLAGYQFNDWTTIATSIAFVVTSTQTSYNAILKAIGVTDTVKNFVKSN